MIRRKTDPPRGILKTTVADRQRYRHERYHPSPDLDPYVEHYWVVEWDLRGQAPEQAETLPHPSEHISRINVVEDFLRSRRPEPDENVPLVMEIVYAVAKDRGILKVEDLVDRYGLNKRTLQRLFARYVGVSPKWVIQRYRLHEAAEQLAAGASFSQATIALNLGYSDQAHFVRDFKAIIGVSPAAYARAARQG